ncbi:hypothetical protein LTR84_007441 [Exophiala bonariae]|uniref:Luciferase domain-containing protein n=1 Tax=Exophiala bonariae TaxID=1690606 RepID=A0AAV9MYI5_9EURO|nr:hypothetical protein LTR84_007441 [Exophiala bonariae]
MDIYTPDDVSDLRFTPFSPPSLSLFHYFPTYLLVIGLITFLWRCFNWCLRDYQAFKDLGPGGTPYNVYGWLSVTFFLKPFTLAERDTLWTGDYPDGAHKEVQALPVRRGQRPDIRGIAPQRQFSQCPTREMNKQVLSLFTSVVHNNPNILQQNLSSFEKHHLALFVHPSVLANSSKVSDVVIASKGELGHIHGDTSLHLYLSPQDAKVVIEKGWAQRHRLARTQPWWLGHKKFICGIGDTFLLIYAPRDESELKVLSTLIGASARFMTGSNDIVLP